MEKKISLGDLVSSPLVDDEIGCLGKVISIVTKIKGDKLKAKSGDYSWSGEIDSVDKIYAPKIKGPSKIVDAINDLTGILRDSKGNYHYFNKGQYMGHCRKYYKGYCHRNFYDYEGYTFEQEDETKTDFENKLKRESK